MDIYNGEPAPLKISIQFCLCLAYEGSVAAAQKSCRDWIKKTIVFIVDSFYCFIVIVSIVSCSIVLIQLD